MIRCPNCGTKNKKNAKFCATCGKSLENANRIVKKNQPKKGNEALVIVLVVCLLLGGGYFAYTRYATSNSKGTLFNELGLGQKKDSQKKQDSKAKLAKAKSENESLKKEKKSDQDSSLASSSSNEASSNSKTVSSVTQPHNDPQLKEDGNAGLEDIQGHWNLVKRVNDPDEGMPTDFDWNDDHLTENFSDGSQGEMTADTIRWSDIDQVYYLSDDSGQQFTFNLEEKSINGERRVLLKSINQGMTAWYERN